ncbi:hypothetical protein [Faecalibacterium sp. 9]|uniref:hypothetical protein n=1 Tax=Faecalibacterium sp. 9 TaxID=3402018 RepID=UPI003AAB20AA
MEINFPLKASPGRGKLSPQVTDEGAGQQHFTLSTPHPALRATCSPFCRYATFSPGAGEICPQGVKALAPGQAAKVDFRVHFSNFAAILRSLLCCLICKKAVFSFLQQNPLDLLRFCCTLCGKNKSE